MTMKPADERCKQSGIATKIINNKQRLETRIGVFFCSRLDFAFGQRLIALIISVFLSIKMKYVFLVALLLILASSAPSVGIGGNA